jgi:hypothetical protein
MFTVWSGNLSENKGRSLGEFYESMGLKEFRKISWKFGFAYWWASRGGLLEVEFQTIEMVEIGKNSLCKVFKSKFFPAKFPFSKIQKKNLAGKIYFAKERGP